MMHILLVDDDQNILRLLEDSLSYLGYPILPTLSGETALTLLGQINGPVLIILDWVMPRMSGIEICRRIRQITPPKLFYIIILTGQSGGVDNLVQAIDAGADEFLTKPVEMVELHARIRVGERILRLQVDLYDRMVELENAFLAQGRAEKALRQAEEYHHLFNLVGDPVIVFDPHSGEILDVNQTACDAYLISHAVFVQMNLRDLLLESSDQTFAQYQKLSLGTKIQYETIYKRIDGLIIDVFVKATVIEYKQQLAILTTSSDITERKKNVSIIRQAEEEWKATVDTIADVILLEDLKGTLRRCNRAACSFFQLSFKELLGREIDAIYKKNFFNMWYLNEFLFDRNSSETRTVEVPRLDKDEWYEITFAPVVSPLTQVTGWVHIIKNITVRKLADLSLRRLTTAIEQAADSIIITASGGIIEFVNPAFEETTGWTRADAQNRHFLSLLNAPQKETYEQITEALVNQSVWTGEWVVQRKDGGTSFEELTLSPVFNEEDQLVHFVIVSRNISEKRRLESIAEAVNTMDKVGYVFSGIRHELGNPVNSIKTALTVLKANIDSLPFEAIVEYINRSLTEVVRVEYLLKTLKTFSQHENPRIEVRDVVPFIENFLSLVVKDISSQGIQVVSTIHPNVSNCYMDHRALHQVLLNLVANAVDAMDGTESPTLSIDLIRDGGQLIICVTDNGIGMDQQQVGNLFKPFYTSKPHGTGLGLTIVKKMMAKMNGTVEIKSTLGVGTTVLLSLEAPTLE